jgi:hypothetical protein
LDPIPSSTAWWLILERPLNAARCPTETPELTAGDLYDYIATFEVEFHRAAYLMDRVDGIKPNPPEVSFCPGMDTFFAYSIEKNRFKIRGWPIDARGP